MTTSSSNGNELDANDLLGCDFPIDADPKKNCAFNERARRSELNTQAAMIGDGCPLYIKGVVRVQASISSATIG